MNSEKGMFQRALAAIVEGRSRQARRYVDTYMASHRVEPGKKR